MCGIAGCFQPDRPTTPEDRAAVQRILDAQQHRGPDDSGLYQDERVVLGHRRLSIIDLSAAGRQPMSNEDGTVWATFNGEIYNFRALHAELAGGHQFHSATDTEVILHGYEQWGIDGLVRRIEGMFSFALYDARGAAGTPPKFFVVRDRLGIKPLYYHQAPTGAVWFGSEVKSLQRAAVMPDDLDRVSLAGFLLFGSVPWPRTTSRAVRCLPPGHYLEVRPGHVREVCYWDLEYVAAQVAGQRTDAEELPATLREAVDKHLISDVPTGIFLSAGVDSSALVALARQAQHAKLVTLTVGFAEREWSEADEARAFARHFGTEHHEITASREDFRSSIPALLEAMDQPTNDGLNTYVVSRLAKQAGLKVLLSGAGGDEVFWGYSHYRRLSRWQGLVKRFFHLPRPMQQLILQGAAAYGRFSGQERFMRFGHLGQAVPDQAMYLLLRGFFAPEQAAELLGVSAAELFSMVEEHRLAAPASTDGATTPLSPMLRFHYQEVKRYLHDQLLRDTDVFSMAHSIEVRVPLLDHRVLEQASRIDDVSKLDPHINKPLLVRAVNDQELFAVSQRRKRGFSFPMREWMLQQADELEERALQTRMLDRAVVRRLWQQFRADRLHWSRAWSLVVLGAKC